MEATGDRAAHPSAHLCASAYASVLPESPGAFLHAHPGESPALLAVASPALSGLRPARPLALTRRPSSSRLHFLVSSWDLRLQVPVPMFLPTTLESTDKIVETIEELKVKIPSNPLEADILAMAEMIAEAEELDKASSDLCGMPRTAVMRDTGCDPSVSASGGGVW